MFRRSFAALVSVGRLALLVVALAAPASAADDLDLEGTWYVLIHYTDSDSANPDLARWEDRLWVFERKGSRLEWVDYPIVVFDDRSGRFEHSAHGQRRVMHAWEPNAVQRAQIESGLSYNSRGSKTKTLRRKRDGSWRSAGPQQALSASVVGYHETWSVEHLDGNPVFTRDDVLGSESAESMSGRTRYETLERARDGSRLSGVFARDESRRGTFTMWRAGDVRSVGTKRTMRERLRNTFGPDTVGAPGRGDPPAGRPAPPGAVDDGGAR